MRILEYHDPGSARQGSAKFERGTLKVINTHRQQVIDAWAFNPEISRVYVDGAQPGGGGEDHPDVGDVLVTNRRRPIPVDTVTDVPI